MHPRHLWRRLLAFIADYALAYLLSLALLLPLGRPEALPQAAFAPQQTLLFLILIVASAALTQSNRPSPGKWLMGLTITGQGCAMCREIRRLGPFLLLSLPGLFAPLILSIGAPWPLPTPLIAAAIALVALHCLLPVIRGQHLMPWDRATGFHVSDR